MDAAGLAELMTPTGWTILGALPPYDDASAMAVATKLRDMGHSQQLVAAALTQSRLRTHAADKFGPFADGMLFTQAGLEQATRLTVAARHATRFETAGVASVTDLCCGIGADAMAMAAMDLTVHGVEADEITASIATVNLRHWDTATVSHAQAEDITIPDDAGVYLDPARRTADGKRIKNPENYSPSFSFALKATDNAPAAGIKVAPAINMADTPEDSEVQWIALDGDVVEAGIWRGAAARNGVRRSAAILSTDPNTPAVVLDSAHAEKRQVDHGALGDYLYEPNPAVIRSGLIDVVADDIGGHLIDPTIAYLTTKHPQHSLAAHGFRILDSLPFGVKRLRSYLADRNVGAVTIKKRGTAVTPEELRRKLKLSGDEHATLVLTRVAGAQTVLVVEPLQIEVE